jgi:hypothetical protein
MQEHFQKQQSEARRIEIWQNFDSTNPNTGSSPVRIEAVDFDFLTAGTGDNQPHHLAAFLDTLHTWTTRVGMSYTLGLSNLFHRWT